jgi:hypothetical protein
VAALLASGVACAQACAADKDCPGDLVCEKGLCAVLGKPGVAPPAPYTPDPAAAPTMPPATPGPAPMGIRHVRGESCAHGADCVEGLMCSANRCEVRPDHDTERKISRGLVIGGAISFVAAYLGTLVTTMAVSTTCESACQKLGLGHEAVSDAYMPFVGPLKIVDRLPIFLPKQSDQDAAAFGLYVAEFFEIIGPIALAAGVGLFVRLWNVEAAELAVVPVAGKDMGGFALGGRFDVFSLFGPSHQDLP